LPPSPRRRWATGRLRPLPARRGQPAPVTGGDPYRRILPRRRQPHPLRFPRPPSRFPRFLKARRRHRRTARARASGRRMTIRRRVYPSHPAAPLPRVLVARPRSTAARAGRPPVRRQGTATTAAEAARTEEAGDRRLGRRQASACGSAAPPRASACCGCVVVRKLRGSSRAGQRRSAARRHAQRRELRVSKHPRRDREARAQNCEPAARAASVPER
jgi:hypothetical protein